MYILIYCIALWYMLILSKKKVGVYLNFPVVFSAIWFLFAALSSLGTFGMRKTSFPVHACVILFVLVVDFCYMIKLPHVKISLTSAKRNNSTFVYDFNPLLFWPMQIIALAFATPLISSTISSYLAGNNISMVRMNYFTSALSGNPIVSLLLKEFPFGIIHALVIIFSMYAFSSGKKQYLFAAILNVLLITFVNGGRIGLFNLAITLFIIYIYKKDSSMLAFRLSKKVKKTLYFLVIAAVFVSILRGQSFFKDIIAYFTGGFAFWDYIINNLDSFALNTHLYGQMTFGMFVEPILLVLKYLGVTNAKVPSYYFNYYCQSYYDIGNGTKSFIINNNSTLFYFFYKDFGYIGIIVGAIVLGVLSAAFLKKWKNNNDILSGLLFILLAQTLITGIISYKLIGTTPMFMVITFILCVKKSNVITNLNQREPTNEKYTYYNNNTTL